MKHKDESVSDDSTPVRKKSTFLLGNARNEASLAKSKSPQEMTLLSQVNVLKIQEIALKEIDYLQKKE